MLQSSPHPTKPNDTTDYIKASEAQLDSIFDRNDTLNTNRTILIYIHGGLNSVNSGIRQADQLTERILNDCKNPAYPLFIAWDSSLFTAWGEQYYTHRGQNSRWIGATLAPFTALANLGRFVSRLPLSVFEQGYAGLRTMRAGKFGGRTEPPLLLARPEEVNAQEYELKTGGYDVHRMRSANMDLLPATGMFMAASSGPKVISEGVVETGGKIGWDFMLRRTKTMFTLANSHASGGMDLFCRKLAKYCQENPDKKVLLIGHSMGAIVANEIISRYGTELPIETIVYMAAACGVDDFSRIVIPYLNARPRASFYNLSLNIANDYSEIPKPYLEFLSPRGSLLDWIDFYYSSTETDYGWTLGKWDNAILGSRRFLKDAPPNLKHQIHFKEFGYGSQQQFGPQHHGSFGERQFWDPDFWKNN